MGWPFDDIVEFVEDVGDAVVDVAEDAWDGAVEVVETGTEVLAGVGGVVGDTFAGVMDVADTVTGGAVSWGMDVIDDYVFDPVDYVTGGIIDIDYDDGTLSASVGIEGIAHAGASIGEGGVTTSAETIGAEAGIGLTDSGFQLDTTAGINYGPLPYVDGHVHITTDGDIMIDGEIQGTIPTPVGLLSGEVQGGFVRTDEGWGTYVDADGALRLPSGTTIRGGVEGAYMEDEDGSYASIGVEGSVSSMGLGTVGGGVGYTRLEEDGEVLETAHVEGYASGFGARVEAEADYIGISADGIEYSDWTGDVNVEGMDAQSILALGGALLGEAGVEVPDSVAGIVGQLGDGDTGALLGNLLEGEQMGQFVQSLGSGAAQELAGKLVDDGTLGQFVDNLGGDAASQFIGDVAQGGGLADLVGNLDPQQTAALLSNLAAGVGQQPGPPAAQPQPDPAAQAQPEPTELPEDDLLGTSSLEGMELDPGFSQPYTPAPVEGFPQPDPTFDDVLADPLAAAPPEAAPEPVAAPVVDEFEQSIDTGEQVQADVVEMFDGLGTEPETTEATE